VNIKLIDDDKNISTIDGNREKSFGMFALHFLLFCFLYVIASDIVMVIVASTMLGIGFVFLFLMLEDLGLCLSCVALFLGGCKE
jgi:Flp pilus assembly protein TadB